MQVCLFQMLPNQQIPTQGEISELLLSLQQRQHVQSSTDVISGPQLPEQHTGNQLNISAANDQVLKGQYCQPNMGIATYDSVKCEPDLVLQTGQMKLQTPHFQQMPLEDQDLDLSKYRTKLFCVCVCLNLENKIMDNSCDCYLHN